MIILNDFFQNRIEEPTAFTIGKFDGLHRGHELLFEDVLAQKECLPCILTFKISPRVAILKEEDRNLITAEERRKELERKGLEYLLEIPASEEFFALKQTVQKQAPIGVETNINDLKDKVNEDSARVIFLEYVREERKFDSLDALKEQNRKDTDFAFRFFNHRASEGNSNP